METARRVEVNVNNAIDKQYESLSLQELLDAPVSALQGISEGDAQKLKEAFNITTIRDLAMNKFFLRSQAIYALAQSEGK
jgi:hypothetical protein